jgi:hypothetical protein
MSWGLRAYSPVLLRCRPDCVASTSAPGVSCRPRRARMRDTVVGCHAPPCAVGTRSAFRWVAIFASDSPAARSSSSRASLSADRVAGRPTWTPPACAARRAADVRSPMMRNGPRASRRAGYPKHRVRGRDRRLSRAPTAVWPTGHRAAVMRRDECRAFLIVVSLEFSTRGGPWSTSIQFGTQCGRRDGMASC